MSKAMFKNKPFFLITIDTEGDNLWSRPHAITTKNADVIPRFQSFCESYKLKPTYLVNYEMTRSSFFRDFGKDVLKREAAEIGMHLHAWNSPPIVALTKDDFEFQPYLIQYHEDVMREKVKVLTDLLENTFETNMISHRAGRWGFNETYAKLLVDNGYCVDCSVTPHISWESYIGNPDKPGGSNYTHFRDDAYLLNLDDISSSGDSPILEIPMSILPNEINQRISYSPLKQMAKCIPLFSRLFNHLLPPVHWLRPNGKNGKKLVRIVNEGLLANRSYMEFMLHSSELMPGGSPTFPTNKSIEMLYNDLEVLFHYVEDKFIGATLKEYYEWFCERC